RIIDRASRLELPRGLDRHATGDAVIDRKAHTVSDGNEQAASFDELLQVDDAGQSHTAANVITLIRTKRHVGRYVASLPRNRRAAHWDAANDCLRRSLDWRKNDYIEFVAEIWRVANYLVGNVRVRNLQAIKLNPKPAIVLRVGPGVQNGDPRHRQHVSFDFRQLIDSNGLKTRIS